MLAAVLVQPERFEIHPVEIPVPGPRQIRVKLEGCGVCSSNVSPWLGKPWFTYPFSPGALGHEAWGHVDALGSDVAGFSIGERVAIFSSNSFAEYDLAETNAIVRLPEDLEGEPFPAEPLGCAVNVFRRSNLNKGDNVAIIGIGFLGALLTQLATLAEANVIAISRREFALEVAKRFGARHTLQLEDMESLRCELLKITGGKLCQTVIEATGQQFPLDVAAELTRERGRLVIAGYHQDGPRNVNMQLWNWRGIDVVNAHERSPALYLEGMQEAVNAVEAGLLTPGPLYTHRFPLERINEALRLSTTRPDGFMKALIEY